MTQMTLITCAERRRRWSFDERERILAAAGAPGAVVAEVGRRWDVCTSLIYKWRREERGVGGGGGVAPVIVEDKPPSAAREPEAATIMVEVGGARIRIGAGAPAALVVAILQALRS